MIMMNSIVAGRSVIPAWMSKNVNNNLVIKVETNYPCGDNNRDCVKDWLIARRNHYNYIYLTAKKQLRTLLI